MPPDLHPCNERFVVRFTVAHLTAAPLDVPLWYHWNAYVSSLPLTLSWLLGDSEVILVDAARAKVAKPALRKTASGTTTASPRAAASRTSPRHSPTRPTASPLKFAAKTSVATLDEEVAEEEAVVDDDDMPCDVCRCTASGDVGNPMVYCDGCGVGVHVWCYGTSEDKLPEGDWFCDGCNWAAENNPRVAPQCCLCPSTGGALALVAGPKKPTSQRFAHISCAISLQAEGHRCGLLPLTCRIRWPPPKCLPRLILIYGSQCHVRCLRAESVGVIARVAEEWTI
jgi:hypothetical protein